MMITRTWLVSCSFICSAFVSVSVGVSQCKPSEFTGGFSNFECNLVMKNQVSDTHRGMDDVIFKYPGPQHPGEAIYVKCVSEIVFLTKLGSPQCE